MNPQKYLDNFNYKPIFEKILKKHNINSMEANYNRHFQELKKKYLSFMTILAQKSYFNEMPLYYDEPLLYVVILNAPFIDEEKREKYKMYLKLKIVTTFKDNIKEYIFPYKNSDKEKLEGNAIIILKMDSADIVQKAAEALNGIKFDKTHEVIAVTYSDYEKIAKLPKKYEEKKQLEFENANQWEKSNFTEMLLIESKDKITVGTCHFLKKTYNKNYTLANSKEINEIKWSPQGKYLIASKEDKIIFYGGQNEQPITEVNIHAHNYNMSNDENYIVSFSGYSKDVLDKEKKKDEKKGEKKEEKKEEQKDENKEEKKEEKKEEEKVENIDNVFVRDIVNDSIIRSFAIDTNEKFSNFIWSPDSKYIGRVKKDILTVYELPSMRMILDKNQNMRMPVKNGVKQFSWFPNNNILIAITEKYDVNKKKN